MRILLVSPLPPPAGGIATWTEVYCEHVKNTGHSVRLINTSVVGKRVNRQQKRILKDEIARAIQIFVQMRKALHQETYDIVHINTSCSKLGLLRDVGCILLAKKQNIILHCHCNVEDQLGSGSMGRRLLSFAAKRASRVLVLNQRSLKYLEDMGFCNVQIVPNFVEESTVANKHLIRNKIETAIYVGHVRRTKGFFEILEAARMLPNIAFQVVGPVCEDLSSVKLPENIYMLGLKPKNEVLKLLQEADVFLFPSYTEGFSIALLEAMAAGLPVITTDVGANVDMIEDKGGLVIPVKDVPALEHAFLCLQSRELREKMSEWNRNKVLKNYTTTEVMTKLLELSQERVK